MTAGTVAGSSGPLHGVKVVEMAAIGPVPFSGMVLADLGASVVRVDRMTPSGLGVDIATRYWCTSRSKRSIAADLKSAGGLAAVRQLIGAADVLIEGFRPGVMERLGLGPAQCLADNPRLVFGRCSGWGTAGPMSGMAAHDINYVGISGALAALGPADLPPPPPMSLVGDYGGAGMRLVCGVLAALLAARSTHEGQVVETSIAQGALGLMPVPYSLFAAGHWSLTRNSNLTDGGAPFYRCYETRDARYMAVGAIEGKFYRELLARLGLTDRVDASRQDDRSSWPATAQILADTFRQRSRAEWTALFEGSDACVTPVLDMSEAPRFPQHVTSRSFVAVQGLLQPAPSPDFSRTPLAAPTPAPEIGADTPDVLAGLGYSAQQIAGLQASGAVR